MKYSPCKSVGLVTIQSLDPKLEYSTWRFLTKCDISYSPHPTPIFWVKALRNRSLIPPLGVCCLVNVT